MQSITSEVAARATAYGQAQPLTFVDRFGVWLSGRQVRRCAGDLRGKRIGDFGCGFQARLGRTLSGHASEVTLVDIALAADLKSLSNVRAVEAVLPDALQRMDDASLDAILCLSVLEHLWRPLDMLKECHRILAPGGVCLLNVPSWRGKRWLEFSAFRLGLSPREEMDDHKTYYDPRDLWPLLVAAGFRPSNIRCFKHKFGLNTFAVCTRADGAHDGHR